MGIIKLIRDVLELDKTKNENNILKNYVNVQNELISSIYQKAREYQGTNLAVGYVGFHKIEELAGQALDISAEKIIELANNENTANSI